MPRSEHYEEYSDFIELTPGVFIDYEGGGVYIVDDEGEVACWVIDEMDDVSAFTASLSAVALAAKKGASAVRENLENKGETLRNLMIETFEKVGV